MNAAPLLETARLRLRAHTAQDFSAVAQLWADPGVVAHISGTPSLPHESWARLLRYMGHWPAMGYGYWAVEEKATGHFIGECGFAHFKREMHHTFCDAPEAGWVFVSAAHGKGYATEAMSAALAWGDAALDHTQSWCMIAPANTASSNLAHKLGYAAPINADYGGEPVTLFQRPRARP